MAELDDRLKRLVSDDQSMKKVLDMASAIMAQRSAAHAEPEKKEEKAAEPDMASMLASILQQQKGESKAEPNAENTNSQKTTADTADSKNASSAQQPEQKNTVSALAEALPQLMQALSGNGELIEGDRLNLIKAMKPYLSDKRLGSIDRALRMANVTKAAKSALHILGR